MDGADLNATDLNGNTALVWAANKGDNCSWNTQKVWFDHIYGYLFNMIFLVDLQSIGFQFNAPKL